MKELRGRSIEGTSDGGDSPEIAQLLVDGKTSIAVRILRTALAADPEDLLHKSELACALAFAGETVEAEGILRTMSGAPLAPPVESRVIATRALLASKKRDLGSIETYLSAAYNADRSNPLLHLLMGRYHMLVDGDLDRAEHHLRLLVRSMPGSVKAPVHLTALLSENGKRIEGRTVAIKNAIVHPFSAAATLAAFYSSVVTLPMNGGVFLAALVVLSLAPYLGPLIFAGWLVVTIGAYFSLRRIWPRIVLVSGFAVVTLAIGYLARAIVWGRLFP